MKEVKFRWVDKYLIQMTLKTKFSLLAVIAIAALISLSQILYYLFNQQITAGFQNANLTQVNKIADIVTISESYLSAEQQEQFHQELIDKAYITHKQNVPQDVSRTLRQQGGSLMDKDSLTSYSQATSSDFIAINQLEDLSQILAGAKLSVIASLGLLSLVMLIACYYISTFVGGALYTTVEAIKRAADGDLTGRLNFFEAKDEFSILAISIDTLVERQHNLVTQITQANTQIRAVVQDFRQNATQGQSLAAQQRAHLDSLTVAMDQMTTAVREVAYNAEQSTKETQESNQQVDAGAKDIAVTVDAISELANEINQASSAVSTLNDNAAQIDQVVTTINSISEQTNLLALNAAIEAARAGEQGRGFAVVADEVRTLAGRTQAATVEIKSMIEALQSGAQDLTQVISRTVEKANQGKTYVLDTGEDLASISEHSEKVYAMSLLIATSAEEQSAVANEIATSLIDIRNQSHDVEHSANQSVSGCDELHATAEKLDALLIGLKV